MRLPAPNRPDAAAPPRPLPLLTPSVWLLAAALLQGCQTPPAAPAAAQPAAATAPAGQKAVPAAPPRATAAAATGAAAAPQAAPAPAAPATPATPAATSAGTPAQPAQARPPGADAPAAPAAAAAPPPGGPPPFATVVREARRLDGPLTLWQKDDKVWIELRPAQFGKPFLLSPKIKSGIGEAFVLGGLMAYPVNGAGGVQVVEFVRVHNQIRLQARNTDVSARAGTPEARAVEASYSHSLLGAAPVASQPHPDRKSVLIEANGIFLSDMLGIGMMLQRGLRQGYGLDRANSVITAVRGNDHAVTLETQSHVYTPGNAMPGLNTPPGIATPMLPRLLPDSRSMLVGLSYSLAPLPDEPMAPRPADPRVGLFTSTVLDFSDDLQMSPRQRYVNRWRLEKKDPAAERSEPLKPITFWIDRNVPLVYRETVRAAILEWNRAFEKIGFIDAIRVEQQPDDAAWDTLDFGYPSVRWMMNADPVFGAIGPSHVDPRSGEILDADIAFEGLSARSVRTLRAQVLGGGPRAASGGGFAAPFVLPQALSPTLPQTAATEGESLHADGTPHDPRLCLHGMLAAEQLGYALDVLEARGELDPDGPVARQFVLDYVKDSILHEVGHALGLRHNFRASRAYTEAQLADPEFTRAHGISGSVMEYNAINLAEPGRTTGMPFQTTLGPYDYWAVEYSYKPMAPGTKPAAERAELQKIAARSAERELGFGTDEDNVVALDPEIIQLDLGADPIAFAKRRIAIARDLFKRQESRQLPPDRDYAVLRRSISFAIADTTRAMGVLARQIGAHRTLREFPGSGREPLVPVPAAAQREALDLMLQTVLGADGLTLSPALQRRLAPDFLDRAEGAVPTDYSVQQRLLDLQRAVLNFLMSDVIATRILDGVPKFDDPGQAFSLGEMYGRLSAEVWRELDRRQPIPSARRDLQRDHVNRLSLAVVRPTGTGRADVRGQLREQARALLARLDATLKLRAPLEAETRAHLADSADTLRQALSATIVRQAL
ncbi:MAG: zinc-dependent metalloprotease [Betaproteobacteria bacterium]